MKEDEVLEYKDDRFIIKVEDGIVYVTWLKEYVDFQFVEDGTRLRLELTKGVSYPMLSDIRLTKSGTREARERLSAKDGADGVKAVAVLVNSSVHKIIFNFFTSIYKAPAPCRIFTDKGKALQWLSQYK